MYRRCMILVPVAMIALALTGSAQAQSMDRVSPVASTAILEGETLEFKVHLGGMIWPWCWHQADWYVDGALTASQNLGNVQSADIKFSWLGNAAGTHVVKVRAKYDNTIGVHVWSDYITWTVTVVSPDTYTVERSGPEQRTEIVHYVVHCGVEFGGLVSQATWQQVEWYTDGVLYSTGTLTEGPFGYYSDIYATFTIGTHEVKVRAKWRLTGAEVWTDYTKWTIEVVPHPPTASCVAPSSPVSMMQGGTQGFTARGTDVGEMEHALEIAGVRWYIDGVLQSTVETGTIWASTVDNTWSHTFDTEGTYQVEAVFYDYEGYSSASGQAVWTVVVERQVHAPSATIVSPGSSVTVYAGGSVTFEATGTDAGNDLRLCEVLLEGVFQTNASFSGAASGSTAEWTHTFNAPGTYHVGFVPLDLAGGHGTACTWTVVVERQVHEPSASTVSPGSSVTVYAGGSVTFKARGTDAGNDLRLCEVSLDGVPQTNASFSGAASGSTAEWTYTFNTPGTYHVAFIPLDLAGDHGTACTWTVEVEGHDPSGTGVSPSSPVTIDQGTQETFTLRGTDPGGDLRLCEVSLDGAFQTNAPFSGASSGSTAEWTCTFNTPGTHQVGFVPLDLAGNRGTVCTWTVEVEAHSPSGTIVSPSSPVTVCTGVPVTFTLKGADPAGDLWLCEVSLDGVFQMNTSFSGAASGSTAAWTHTFNTPGTHQILLRPLDWANNYGTAKIWTVVVQVNPAQAGLTGVVIELDAQGRAKGPLAGAKVDLAGPAAGTAATDGQGKFAFAGLNPGAYTANVSKTGYYAQSRSVSLATGETKDEVFRLTPESLTPSAFDFSSPDGKHFIEGMPGSVSLSIIVAWNGSPGSVRFNLADTWHTATITDLGAGKAQASLNVTVPTVVSNSSELLVEVANGDGERTIVNTGVYLYPIPPIIATWFPGWQGQEQAPDYAFEKPWDLGKPIKYGDVEMKAEAGLQGQLSFDGWAGTFDCSAGGFGRFGLKVPVQGVRVVGEAELRMRATVAIELAGCNPPTITPGWALSLSGKAGVEAPATVAIVIFFPPAAPAMDAVRKIRPLRKVVDALELRLYLTLGAGLSGEYEAGKTGECFLAATSVSGSLTLGIEGQVVLTLGKNAKVGVYAGGTGTPEFELCPDFQFKKATIRAYAGVFATLWSWRFSKEVGLTIEFGPDKQSKVVAMAAIPGSSLEGEWQPIGDSCLRWGQMNLLVGEGGSGGRLHTLSVQGETSQETALVENVVSLASPAIISGASETLILFCLHDPNKPWFAATDIGTLRQAGGQPWVLDRIADDQAAEFSPSVVAADSGTILAAWERVSGDVSDANEPGQVAPHMEIVAAWFDPGTGLWSTPAQLTSNAVVDHRPMPVALGATRGILWIANEGSATIGDANSGDRLMFAKWSGSGWNEPQTLWSAQKGILSFAFVADAFGEGHVAFAVDEDADPNTTPDCELYLLWTANGTWQTATQLTSDFVEDAMPTLVAPNGVPICIWSADGTLVYSPLRDWNPRQVYSEYTLANDAPSLDGVTMPGGAAIAYTVQGPNGVDIVASFYDADLDCWSLPRQLTEDEHAETALSLACDADELVIAYLKTQTLRTDMEVEIDGQIHHIENVPQPGRTDLYVLRHALSDDLAVASESVVLDPANPAPDTAATIRATIENRGDLPLQNVEAAFYDGDPSKGGVAIGDRQVISGTLIAGAKENVSVSWKVPGNQRSHEVFVVVDPCLAVEDRDRSNNVLAVHTVLPDLAIETCWSTEVSSTSMALTARVVNTGVIPVGAFAVSWRLGARDGEQIGTSTIPSLIAGGAFEATFTWDTSGHLDGGQQAKVFAVADSAGAVPELDETNNVSSLAVFHPPVLEP